MDAKLIRHAEVQCRHCDTRMDVIKIKKHRGVWAVWMICAGVLLCLVGGLFLGVLLLVGGIYAAMAEMTVCSCPKCGSYFKVLPVGNARKE